MSIRKWKFFFKSVDFNASKNGSYICIMTVADSEDVHFCQNGNYLLQCNCMSSASVKIHLFPSCIFYIYNLYITSCKQSCNRMLSTI